MLEIIHTVAGGGVGVTLIWALIRHPQALAAILALIVAPFPGERVYGRYKEMSGLGSPEETPTKEVPRKRKKAKRGK
jgi:hypothetical protein